MAPFPLPFATFPPSPSTFCCLCCVSVVPIHCAVLLWGQSFCRRGTAQHIVGSRCTHTHPTERPLSSTSHPVKSHTQMTPEVEAAFAMICRWLPTPQTAHPMGHHQCSREVCTPSSDSHPGHTMIPFLHVAGPPSLM